MALINIDDRTEINAGYTIIAAEAYEHSDGAEHAVVLGKMETRFGMQYVTWERTLRLANPDKRDYFYGHYSDSGDFARADYHERLMEHYRNNEGREGDDGR